MVEEGRLRPARLAALRRVLVALVSGGAGPTA